MFLSAPWKNRTFFRLPVPVTVLRPARSPVYVVVKSNAVKREGHVDEQLSSRPVCIPPTPGVSPVGCHRADTGIAGTVRARHFRSYSREHSDVGLEEFMSGSQKAPTSSYLRPPRRHARPEGLWGQQKDLCVIVFCLLRRKVFPSAPPVREP